MSTITTATLFVRRMGCQPSESAEGFDLVMHLIDNQGPHRCEPYVVKWSGDEARAWWAEHGPLLPGTALAVELENPRSFVNASKQPETRARVRHCKLLPARACAPAAAPQPAPMTH